MRSRRCDPAAAGAGRSPRHVVRLPNTPCLGAAALRPGLGVRGARRTGDQASFSVGLARCSSCRNQLDASSPWPSSARWRGVSKRCGCGCRTAAARPVLHARRDDGPARCSCATAAKAAPRQAQGTWWPAQLHPIARPQAPGAACVRLDGGLRPPNAAPLAKLSVGWISWRDLLPSSFVRHFRAPSWRVSPHTKHKCGEHGQADAAQAVPASEAALHQHCRLRRHNARERDDSS